MDYLFVSEKDKNEFQEQIYVKYMLMFLMTNYYFGHIPYTLELYHGDYQQVVVSILQMQKLHLKFQLVCAQEGMKALKEK